MRGRALLFCLLALAGCNPGEGPAPLVVLGEYAPADLAALIELPVQVAVLIRPEDCLSCEVPTTLLREAQLASGSDDLLVLVNGPAEPLVKEFFDGMRVVSRIQSLDAQRYHELFGYSAPLTVLAFQDGRLVMIRAPTGSIQVAPDVIELPGLLSFLSVGDGPSRDGSPP